jgi:hypothetical protein
MSNTAASFFAGVKYLDQQFGKSEESMVMIMSKFNYELLLFGNLSKRRRRRVRGKLKAERRGER